MKRFGRRIVGMYVGHSYHSVLTLIELGLAPLSNSNFRMGR